MTRNSIKAFGENQCPQLPTYATVVTEVLDNKTHYEALFGTLF